MAEMALVSDINGVCSSRETFLMTSRPMKVASISVNSEVKKAVVSGLSWPPSAVDSAKSIQGANDIVRCCPF